MSKEKKNFYICFVLLVLVAIAFSKYFDHILTYDEPSYDNDNYSSYTSSYSSSFTNDYGTSTTKCAHSGCSRYIASSGDTNCCTVHSNKCGNCRCYIDEDAMYCMDCLMDALS